jgi:hypothetical protein
VRKAAIRKARMNIVQCRRQLGIGAGVRALASPAPFRSDRPATGIGRPREVQAESRSNIAGYWMTAATYRMLSNRRCSSEPSGSLCRTSPTPA